MRRFKVKMKAALFVVMLAACTGTDNVTAPAHVPSAPATDAALLRGTVSGLLGTVDNVANQLLPAVLRTTSLLNTAVVTRTVGPEGGVIRGAGVELRVPRGALSSSVSITMVVPAGPYVQAQFYPHGLTFREPVTLRFSTAGTSAAGTGSSALVGTYFTLPILQALITPEETFDASVADGAVEFRIRHFSAYAPAFRRGYTAAGN
jgi:hypothetical protein